MTSESSEDVANRILCQSCFHQSLYLPATSSHPRLRVTFSTSTNFSDTSLPVILFITPLFGTRWCGASFDHLACTTGVRVIVVDRFVPLASLPCTYSTITDEHIDPASAAQPQSHWTTE